MLLDNLKTDRLMFRRFTKKDIPAIAPFFADRDAMYFYLAEPLRLFDENELNDFLADWDDGETCFLYTVYHDDNAIGLFSLEDYIPQFRHAETGFAVTDPSARGQGFASEMIAAAVDHLFLQRHFKKIMMRHIEGNEASEHLIRKHGFTREGRLREHVLRDGDRWLDVFLYALTEEEYENRFLL